MQPAIVQGQQRHLALIEPNGPKIKLTFHKEQLAEGVGTDGHEDELRDHTDGRTDRPLEHLEDELEVDFEAHEEEGDDQDEGEADVDAGVQLGPVPTDLQAEAGAVKVTQSQCDQMIGVKKEPNGN